MPIRRRVVLHVHVPPSGQQKVYGARLSLVLGVCAQFHRLHPADSLRLAICHFIPAQIVVRRTSAQQVQHGSIVAGPNRSIERGHPIFVALVQAVRNLGTPIAEQRLSHGIEARPLDGHRVQRCSQRSVYRTRPSPCTKEKRNYPGPILWRLYIVVGSDGGVVALSDSIDALPLMLVNVDLLATPVGTRRTCMDSKELAGSAPRPDAATVQWRASCKVYHLTQCGVLLQEHLTNIRVSFVTRNVQRRLSQDIGVCLIAADFQPVQFKHTSTKWARGCASTHLTQSDTTCQGVVLLGPSPISRANVTLLMGYAQHFSPLEGSSLALPRTMVSLDWCRSSGIESYCSCIKCDRGLMHVTQIGSSLIGLHARTNKTHCCWRITRPHMGVSHWHLRSRSIKEKHGKHW
eukprot:m.1257044 g.1257044  ORF g.1257044 m.1257044 type:complete len:404 (-) comp24712_c0_seq43:704-1915(-)